MASLLFNLRTWQSFFAQPLSKSSLVYLLVWHPPLHTPYISSPSHCLLFTALAHTNTACFAIILRLCTNFSFALTPIYTLVRPELITGFQQPLQINDFGHATLYTTIFLVYPLLTTSTHTFTGARDSEWQWHQLGHMQICTLTQTHSHASIPPLKFLQAGCPSCCPTNSIKALKAQSTVLVIRTGSSSSDNKHTVLNCYQHLSRHHVAILQPSALPSAIIHLS